MRGGTAGHYTFERLAPLLAEHGEDALHRAIDAAAADPWYRRQPDRLRPEVIFGSGQLRRLLAANPPRAASRATPPSPKPDLVPTTGGGFDPAGPMSAAKVGEWWSSTCPRCNRVQRFVWDGSTYRSDHRECA